MIYLYIEYAGLQFGDGGSKGYPLFRKKEGVDEKECRRHQKRKRKSKMELKVACWTEYM